ncbi:hypothetical protein U91I_03937 [alpha proteobacterium U9-1i]|nr:hypothetical protein U91I_03937 [alpha proteobacterium U9-1i]
MRRVLAALAIWAIATPAIAQDASVGALGLELIAQSSADGVFDVIPSEQVIAVRHARSGLVCRLSRTNSNRLIVFPQAARGEDVACDSTDGRERITVYATRFSFATTLQEQIEGASSALHRSFPGARVLPGPASASAAGGLPASVSARFSYANAGGEAMYWRTSLAMVDNWVVKVRYQTVAPDAAARQSAERTADAIWRGVMGELMTNRAR